MREKKAIYFVIRFILIIFVLNILNILNISQANASVDTNSYLKYLRLSEGEDLNFSSNKYTYITEVRESVDEITVKARPSFTNDNVYVNGVLTAKEDNYRADIDLVYGKNKITIDVIDCYNRSKTTYTVYVYRGGKNAVFFNNIKIDYNEIGYNQKINIYNIERDKKDNNIVLELFTVDENYEVEINGKEIDPSKSIKIKFDGLGKYIVRIRLIDKQTSMENTYTLNIYVGIPVTPDVEGYVNSILKPNQWVIVNGRYRYNNSEGKPLKNQWFYDKKTNGYYYLDNRGNMQTGWYEVYDNAYYYLGTDGKMQTGWVYTDNHWYYLNYYGMMKTGWIYENGNWYFLNDDGSMVTGWKKINGIWYYFSVNGQMRTGWMLYDKKWYLLNEDGSMKTGWYYYKDEWYYMNPDGSMRTGDWLYYKSNWYYINYSGTMRCGWLFKNDKYYYFNEDGTMNKTTKEIDGYTYYFNDDGSVNFV